MIALALVAATGLSLAGAALVYLAHPNQFLLARRLPAWAGWAGGVGCAASLGLWMAVDGVLVGLSIAMTLWMLVGTGLPYAAAWADARRPAPRRHGRLTRLARLKRQTRTTADPTAHSATHSAAGSTP